MKPSTIALCTVLLFLYSYAYGYYPESDQKSPTNQNTSNNAPPLVTRLAEVEDNNRTARAGIYLPLYSYPTSSQWLQAAVIKQLFPEVPFLACVNPSNGPGIHFDEKFATGIDSLTKAGILVGGYVATHYGLKPQSEVEKEIRAYKTWYDKINGICFDEMKNKVGKEDYYRYLTEFSKSLGLNFTVGNPGTDVSPTYVGTVDYMKIYEGPGAPALSKLQGWHLKYDKKNFITIAYNVSHVNYTYLAEATKYVGFLYVTDDFLPNPYNTLPNYLFNIARFLNSTSMSNK
jgi:Spherulation-specific family 4